MIYFIIIQLVIVGIFAYMGITATNEIINKHNQ